MTTRRTIASVTAAHRKVTKDLRGANAVLQSQIDSERGERRNAQTALRDANTLLARAETVNGDLIAQVAELQKQLAAQVEATEQVRTEVAAKDKQIGELQTANNTNETAARGARALVLALEQRLSEATRIMAVLGTRPALTAVTQERG